MKSHTFRIKWNEAKIKKSLCKSDEFQLPCLLLFVTSTFKRNDELQRFIDYIFSDEIQLRRGFFIVFSLTKFHMLSTFKFVHFFVYFKSFGHDFLAESGSCCVSDGNEIYQLTTSNESGMRNQRRRKKRQWKWHLLEIHIFHKTNDESGIVCIFIFFW